jgi:hypothetical protein
MSSARNADGSTHAKNGPGLALRLACLGVAAVLAIFGVGAVAKGIDGHSTVRGALGLEKVVGAPQMTPAGIAPKAKAAGVAGVALPTCSVAGKAIRSGDDARCFAQYMRIDALIATGGKTYAQMPRFASADGKGTNIEAQAQKLPNGVALPNPARNVWVTETALSTALNTSYMAEQLSVFGIAVGGSFLLVALALAGFVAAGAPLPRMSLALARKRGPAGSPAQA